MRIFLVLLLPVALVGATAATDGVEFQPGSNMPHTGPSNTKKDTNLTGTYGVVAHSDGVGAVALEGSRLRGKSTKELEETLSNLQRNEMKQLVEDIPGVVDFADQAPSERVDTVHQLNSKLKTWISKLDEVEMLTVANGVMEYSAILRNAEKQLKKLEKPVSTIIRMLELDVEKELKGDDGEDTTLITTTNRVEQDTQRHLVVGATGRATLAQQDDTTHSRQKKREVFSHKEKRNHYRRLFEEQRERAKTVHKSHFHTRMVDMQEAIHYGDLSAARAFSESVLQSHYARHGKRNSGTSKGFSADTRQRQLNKAELCFQLNDCASKMSYYDMFVYFYSDDIDPTTGEVDDNIVKFDEKRLDLKYNAIKNITENLESQDDCDNLLRQFHRQKEVSNVANWEGATVGQVCLAQGSTLFVKLEDAARTMSFTPDKLVAKALDTPQDLKTKPEEEEVTEDLVQTGCNENGKLQFFDRHTANCGKGYAMTSWHVGSCFSGFQINSSCRPTPGTDVTAKETSCQLSYDHFIEYLDRFRVECGNNEALQSWHMSNAGCGGQDMKINYNCVKGAGSSSCEEYETGCNEINGKEIIYFDRHNVKCPDETIMKSWRLEPCGGDQASFKYTCCRPAPKPEPESERKKYLDLIFKRTTYMYPALVKILVVEPISCAEAMYNAANLDEPFPFGDEGNAPGLYGNEAALSMNFNVDKMSSFMKETDELMKNIRFPTFKGTDEFPDLPPVDATWRRKLNERKLASQSIQSQRMLDTSCNENGKLEFLDRHRVDCGAGYGMTGWHVNSCHGGFYVQTYCSPVPDTQVDVRKTSCQLSYGEAIEYLDRFQVGCGNNEALQDWFLSNNGCGGKYMRVEYSCAKEVASTSCKEYQTGCQETNGKEVIYLDRQNLKCPGDELMKSWRMEPCGGGNARFKYTCCSPAPEKEPEPEVETPKYKLDVVKQKEARDRYGQIRNNQESPYNGFADYLYLLNQYKLCAKDLGDKLVEKLSEKDAKSEKYDLKKELDDGFFKDFYEKCQATFFSAMREGIELVFGDRSSTGFVCGMQKSIVNDGKELPGTCCLDAPWELEGDDWGRKYKCPAEGETAKCKDYGPYFSGMSTQACDSYGGTWCPNAVDCSDLRDCIMNYKKTAKEENPSYYDYLDSAPNITDPTSFKQCGRTREYFGYDQYFSNDMEVCENIEQLSQCNDFSFIDEFYGVGGDKEGDLEEPGEVETPGFKTKPIQTIAPGEVGQAPPVPDSVTADLTEPDYSGSEDPLVQNGIDWENAIFTQEQVLDTTESSLEFAENVACPDLPFVGTFPCELAKSIVKAVLLVVSKVTTALLAISQFMMKVKAQIDNIMPIKEAEQVDAVSENQNVSAEQITQSTDTVNQYIYDSFTALFEDIFDKDKASNDYIATLDKNSRDSMARMFSDQTDYMKEVAEQDRDALFKIREDIKDVSTDCVKKIIPGVSFEMQAEVFSKGESKSFLLLTTGLDGKPTKPDFFDIKSVAKDGSNSMVAEDSFTSKKLGSSGEQLITFEKSVKEKMFIVSAGLNEGSSDNELITKTVLLSFIECS